MMQPRVPILMFDRLDKSNPTPLYYQLQQILKEKIESGVWKPGETIPTESEITAQYGISRSTVRQAILALVDEGYLKREKSKGTLVKSSTGRKQVIGALMSFTSEMDMKGIPHYSRLIAQKVMPANNEVAAKLDIQIGTDTYYLKRVRYINDEPFLVDDHFIPYHLCPQIEQKYQENTSLYHLLQEEYQFNLHHGQIVFAPITAQSLEVVEFLKVTPTTSLILAERIVYSEYNVALDYFKAIIYGQVSIDVLSTTDFPKI